MDLTKSVILYLGLYRISLIIAGMVCIFFGYRLFCKGIMNGTKNGGASLDAKGKGIQLTLKNAHPGTFFSLFGVALIIFMVALYPPKFSKKTMNELIELGNEGKEQAGTKTTSTTEVSLQSIEFDAIKSIINEKKDGIYGPDKAYDKLLKEIKDKVEKIDNEYKNNKNAEEAFNSLLYMLIIANGIYGPDKAYDKLLKEIKDKIEKIDSEYKSNKNAEEAFNSLLYMLIIAK